jgi:hypothetical protein
MEKGDLVFVNSAGAGFYIYTTPGSWGYVVGEDEDEGGRPRVQFEHLSEPGATARGEDTGRWRRTDRVTYGIESEHLHVLKDAPDGHDAITELVDIFVRLGG